MIVASSPHIKDWRRRSADVGGLHLATENSGQGQGWMGGHPGEIEYVHQFSSLSVNNDGRPLRTMFAEMLSDMYTETLNSVNENSLEMCVHRISSLCVHLLDLYRSNPTNLSESVRSRLIHSLDRWYFEPHRLPDEEVLACTLLLFEALFRIEGMREAVPLTIRSCLCLHHI
jgi:hypothetical protein